MNARTRLENVLRQLQSRAKKSLGQNFLVSDTVIHRIMESVKFSKMEYLVEIGPGAGALTDKLIELKKPLTVIELDNEFASYWQSQGLKVIHDDALQINWKLLIGEHPLPSTLLVSNLPYQISSSLVIDRSLDQPTLGGMILMFQKEVAQRIRATKSTEHYGLLTVISQTFWRITTVCDAGPRDFQPPPKVASRVLEFSPLPNKINNPQKFLRLVKMSFAQKRKLLKNNLSQLLAEKAIKESSLITWLESRGYTATVRAEELSIEDFGLLYSFLETGEVL